MFICEKNLTAFSQLVDKNDLKALKQPLARIGNFLFDYILSTSLMFESYKNVNLDTLFTGLMDSNKMVADLKQNLTSKLKQVIKKGTVCSEALMITFEECSGLVNFKQDKSFNLIDLNLNLRISHLLFLMSLVINKVIFFFNF